MVCQHTGACTWQILKNETHVYFISIMEIKYTWVFFYDSGPDTYAKEKKDAAIYESAFYPVHCGNGRQNTADAGGNDFQVQAEGYPAWNRCCDPGAERTGGSCRRPCQYGSSYVADPSDCRCGVPVFCGNNA